MKRAYSIQQEPDKSGLSGSTGALHLRTLQSLNDLSSDQSNTVIFALPLEVLRASALLLLFSSYYATILKVSNVSILNMF